MNRLLILMRISIILGTLVTLFLLWESFQVYTLLHTYSSDAAYSTLDFHFIFTIENIAVYFMLLWGVHKTQYSHTYILFTVPMFFKAFTNSKNLVALLSSGDQVPIIYTFALIVMIGAVVVLFITLEQTYSYRYTKLRRLKISLEEDKKDIVSYISVYNAEKKRLREETKKDYLNGGLTTEG